MNRPSKTTRRQFLTTAATAAFGFPLIVRSSALGKDGAVPPSDRIVMGCIGTGGKGRGNLGAFLNFPDVQVVAVCDVDAAHLAMAREMVHKKYGTRDCAAYEDFRDLVARQDIDAVSIATPDHWHGLTSVAAAQSGKDVYCEKPLANSIAEGRAICDAVTANDRILQTGSHERSGDRARFACELVRNGRLGKLHTIFINLPCDGGHHNKVRELNSVPPPMPVPEGFKYDMWLGHTPVVPYTEQRCHFWWRFILCYGGGEMTDRGAHVIDLAQLGAGTDDTGPVEIEAAGAASKSSLYDAFMSFRFRNTFGSGLTMIGGNDGPRGVKFVGTDGSLFIHVHGAKLEAEPESILRETIGDHEIHLGRSPGHHRNFIDCVKSRQPTVAPAEVGHRTATICHLNNMAMLAGRTLTWNPEKERITNNVDVNWLLAPVMRQPWHL